MKTTNNRSFVVRLIIVDIAVLLSAAAVFTLFPGHTAKRIADLYPIVLAAMGAWISFQIYRSIERGRQARRIWALLTAGMGFWSLAETTWTLYDFLGAAPYPSWADLFYLIGNSLLIAFFALQVRFLRLALQGWKRRLAIGLILLFVTLVGIFVCAPMFAEPSRDWLEFGVNLLYETHYLLMLMGATMLTLAVFGGVLGRGWIILAAGMWLYALSYQIFFYANWHDLYYPDNQATPLSIAFDLLYIASYLVILTGLHLRWTLPFPSVQVENILVSIPQSRPREIWVLLSDEGGRTSFVDPRLLRALGATDVGQFTGEFVGTILGLRTDLDGQILQEVQTGGYSRPRKVLLAGQFYALQALREKGPYPDVYWLLTPWDARLNIQPEEMPPLETLLAQAVRGAVLTPSPAELIQIYLQAIFSLFSLMCAHSGGKEIGQQFARQFGPDWSACQEALNSGRPEAVETCRDLLQRALEYVLLTVPADQVSGALERLEAGLGEETIQAVAAANLRVTARSCPTPKGQS
ncbi:MAG: hypothetical protein ACP5ME_10865 [Anaerolineae bacterium]